MQKTIAFITDTHLGDNTPPRFGIDARHNLQLVLDDIALQNVDSLVFGGDVTHTDQYEWFFNHLQKFCPGFKAILGNHDNHAEAVKHYRQPSAGSNALYYAEEDSDAKYIYLDSSSSVIDGAQLAWLTTQLDTPKQILLFIHHPVLGFSTGMDTAYPLKNRDAIAALLQQSPAKVHIICGHYHMADIRTLGNITQYVTPATSFQVKKESAIIDIYNGAFGYRLITVTTATVTTQLYVYQNGSFEAVEG
jgi:Icc protein